MNPACEMMHLVAARRCSVLLLLRNTEWVSSQITINILFSFFLSPANQPASQCPFPARLASPRLTCYLLVEVATGGNFEGKKEIGHAWIKRWD